MNASCLCQLLLQLVLLFLSPPNKEMEVSKNSNVLLRCINAAPSHCGNQYAAKHRAKLQLSSLVVAS